MKISKTEIRYIGLLILVFTCINILTNVLGLWIPKLFKATDLSHIHSIFKEFVRPIAIQTVLFGVCTALAYGFLKNKKLARYAFALVQVLVFHIVFFLNIKIQHGLHLIATVNNWGIKYLAFCGQYLTNILYIRYPINGNFENGMFMPMNIGRFYMHWIFVVIVYYFVVSWLSIKIVDLIQSKKNEIDE